MHRKLDAWKSSMKLAEQIYQATSLFPGSEKFGITAQLRRAAVSVPSNIAEGAARSSEQEFLRFLYIARGSLAEVQTQITLADRLEFGVDLSMCEESVKRTFRRLSGLIKSLQ